MRVPSPAAQLRLWATCGKKERKKDLRPLPGVHKGGACKQEQARETQINPKPSRLWATCGLSATACYTHGRADHEEKTPALSALACCSSAMPSGKVSLRRLKDGTSKGY
jgi:hypothetical protein